MTSARLNRRRLLQGVAASTWRFPAMGTGIESGTHRLRTGGRARVLDAGQRPGGKQNHYRPGRGFQLSIGQEKGIHVNTRIKPTTGDNYVQYTTAMTSSGSPDVVMTYIYNPVISWAANGFIRPIDDYAKAVGIKEEDFFPITWSMITSPATSGG